MLTVGIHNYTVNWGTQALRVHSQSQGLVTIRSGRRCSGAEPVTALICSGRIQTKPGTGYLRLLARFAVTYSGRNATQIHLPLDDVTRTNRDVSQWFALVFFALFICSMVHMK